MPRACDENETVERRAAALPDDGTYACAAKNDKWFFRCRRASLATTTKIPPGPSRLPFGTRSSDRFLTFPAGSDRVRDAGLGCESCCGLYFRFFGFLFSWLAIGLIMALAGVAAIITIYGRDLPDYAQLENYEPATLSRIYSGQGLLMDEFARERRIFTPIDEIPDQVKQAFISAEDKNFYQHHGFDPRGIVAALGAAAQGERLRGASTITQQVMKNFLLTGDRSGERKIKEIILATRLENTLSKDEILQLYLNEIFLGQNSYGVTAAAQIYFAKSLEELTLAETAYLAALPQAPSVLHPVREKAQAIARRNYVLDQMAENGYATRADADAAMKEDLRRCRAARSPRPAARCRRATISPTRSAGSCRRSSATRSCSPAGCPSAPRSTRTCSRWRPTRCATAWSSMTGA